MLLAGDLLHPVGFLLDRGRMTVGLHQQNRGSVAWQADGRIVLDAVDGHSVEKLQRTGNDPGGDDGRDGLGGILHAIEDRQQRLGRGGFGNHDSRALS